MKPASIGMVGVLVICAVILLTAIIIASAPYLAIAIVLITLIWWIERKEPDDLDKEDKR